MPTTLNCSFCLRSSEEVAKLIGGPGVYICDSCVDLCNRILADDAGKQPPFSNGAA
jgi:ATP-dependent Clp protease ATP-binding subunit ClpX